MYAQGVSLGIQYTGTHNTVQSLNVYLGIKYTFARLNRTKPPLI